MYMGDIVFGGNTEEDMTCEGGGYDRIPKYLRSMSSAGPNAYRDG